MVVENNFENKKIWDWLYFDGSLRDSLPRMSRAIQYSLFLWTDQSIYTPNLKKINVEFFYLIVKYRWKINQNTSQQKIVLGLKV